MELSLPPCPYSGRDNANTKPANCGAVQGNEGCKEEGCGGVQGMGQQQGAKGWLWAHHRAAQQTFGACGDKTAYHGGEISICRPINWGYSLLIDSIPVHRGKERMRLHLYK